MDEADQPNLYFAATSAYGVQIVGKDGNLDGVPDRLKRGAPEARFMAGQWGDAAGPRTMWAVDGATGAVQMFADLASDGATTAPSLGNLAYDAAQYPLYTGPSCILVLCLLNPSLCVPPPPDQICAQRAVDVTYDNNGGYLAKITYTGAPAAGAPANFGQIKLTDPAGQITSLAQTQTVAGQFTVPLTGLVAGQVGQINLCSFDAAADGAPYDCCNTTVTFKIPAMNVSQLRCNNDPPYPNLRRDWAGRCDVAERGLGRACPQRARAGEWGF